jgi:hypothetical protein
MLANHSAFNVEIKFSLSKLKSRISQQVVDAQKLGKGPCFGIGRLAAEDSIAQSLVLLVHDMSR